MPYFSRHPSRSSVLAKIMLKNLLSQNASIAVNSSYIRNSQPAGATPSVWGKEMHLARLGCGLQNLFSDAYGFIGLFLLQPSQ